ncbi:MAG: flagellar biosynthetic protein FliQ [Sphingomonas bacterium]
MLPAQIFALAQSALMLVLTIAGPLLVTSMIVGTAIGLFQSLTQVQEATLTFVPKLLSMGLVLLLTMPMIGRALADFMARISDLIVSGG